MPNNNASQAEDIFEVLVPVQFLLPYDRFLQRAAEIGRHSGLEDDWTPEGLNEAVYEVLISSEEDPGMVVRPTLMAHSKGVFTTNVHLRLLYDRDFLLTEEVDLLPEGFSHLFNNILLGALNSQRSPVEIGFEIISDPSAQPQKRLSEHARLNEMKIVDQCKYSGPAPKSLFIP